MGSNGRLLAPFLRMPVRVAGSGRIKEILHRLKDNLRLFEHIEEVIGLRDVDHHCRRKIAFEIFDILRPHDRTLIPVTVN